MDLFNDINFNDNSETSNLIMKTLPIEIGLLLIKKLGTLKYLFPVVYEHYLLILDDEPQHCAGLYKTREGDILPYTYNMLSCLFSFNESFTHLNYILVYPALYENDYKVIDDDMNAISFANILFNEYDIVTDEIVYEVKDIRDRFIMLMFNKRQIKNSDDKLTLKFVLNFPLILNWGLDKIAKKIYIRLCNFESERCFVELFKLLIKQFKHVLFNINTCYIDGVPFYKYDTVNKEFFKNIIENTNTVYDIDTYVIINKKIINMLTKLTEEKMYNKHKFKKYIFEGVFDDFNDIIDQNNDDTITNELIDSDTKCIGEFIIKFLKSTCNLNHPLTCDIYKNEYLLILDKHATGKEHEYKTIDNIIMPYPDNILLLIFKFDKAHEKIEYMLYLHALVEGEYLEETKNLLELCEKLYTKFNININNVIYDNTQYYRRGRFKPKRFVINTYNFFINDVNRKYDNSLPSYTLKLTHNILNNIPKFSTRNGDICPICELTDAINFDTIDTFKNFLKLLQALFKIISILNLAGIKINNIKIEDNPKYKKLLKKYENNPYFHAFNLTDEFLSDLSILCESKKSLYKSLIESIAVNVKKSLNEDRYDYGHNTPSSHLKLRILGVLNNKFGYASLRLKSRRIGSRDFYIANRTNVPNYPTKFELAVVERKKGSEDNFRISISRKGELDILSDDNIKYVLFPKYVGTSDTDYIVYMLDKDDILDIYNNLKSILDRCKEEIKQGKRNRKTIKVNKSISDKYKNFLVPTAGNDGVCLSNQCVEKLSVYTFKLKNKIY